MKTNKKSIFWFRRDLRLHDNHALFQALSTSEKVIPIFIFDVNILDKLSEEDRRVCLLYDRLEALNKDLSLINKKIQILYGKPVDVFTDLLKTHDIDAVYINTDYEPYATDRDEKISKIAQKNNTSFESLKDQVIFEKDEILSDTGNPYVVYSPYMRKWVSKFRISLTAKYDSESLLDNLSTISDVDELTSLEQMGFKHVNYNLKEPDLSVESLKNYEDSRNFPYQEGTINLSVHLRFGFLSVRELAKVAYQYSETLLKELIWRSFFCQILWRHPHVVNSCFKTKFENLDWSQDHHLFLKWKRGVTGYPIVDAGMRELFETGYMHNRVRMVTASFLVKNLGIDWRLGEAYFASMLMDYDLASNNGNWQWVAGTGCDSAPYFRVFNPVSQQEKFDGNFEYCRKWLPEMDENGKYVVEKVVDVKRSRLEAIARYKVCTNN